MGSHENMEHLSKDSQQKYVQLSIVPHKYTFKQVIIHKSLISGLLGALLPISTQKKYCSLQCTQNWELFKTYFISSERQLNKLGPILTNSQNSISFHRLQKRTYRNS